MPKYGAGGPSRRGSHALSDALGCEVRWYLYVWRKLKARGSNRYLTTGTTYHTAVAYHHGARIKDRVPAWLREYPDMMEALRQDSVGRPAEMRAALEMLAAYQAFDVGQPWEPVYVEEEFEATLGRICPNAPDEPQERLQCVDKAGRPVLDPDGVQRVIELPRLRDEVVTCRPDMIARRNGKLYVWDHKTAGSDKTDRSRLPVLRDDFPDYTYKWQAMYNLHVVRASLEIDGFVMNRIKRDRPFDFDRADYEIESDMYNRVPGTILKAVQEDRARKRRVAEGARMDDFVPTLSECSTWGACPYARLCYADNKDIREWRQKMEYFTGDPV